MVQSAAYWAVVLEDIWSTVVSDSQVGPKTCWAWVQVPSIPRSGGLRKGNHSMMKPHPGFSLSTTAHVCAYTHALYHENNSSNRVKLRWALWLPNDISDSPGDFLKSQLGIPWYFWSFLSRVQVTLCFVFYWCAHLPRTNFKQVPDFSGHKNTSINEVMFYSLSLLDTKLFYKA